MKRLLCMLLAAALTMSAMGGCGGSPHSGGSGSDNSDDNSGASSEEVQKIINDGAGLEEDTSSANPSYTLTLNGSSIMGSAAGAGVQTAAGTNLKAFNFAWHVNPNRADDYYTVGMNGSEISGDDMTVIEEKLDQYAAYVAYDIKYIPSDVGLSFSGSAKDDDETEAASYYASDVTLDGFTGPFIFATLPSANSQSTMTHAASAAYACPVLHITKPGTYTLSGTWNGQIWVDAGDSGDDNAKVTLILNGLTVKCEVGPALVFHDLYECGPSDETALAAKGTKNIGSYVSQNAGAKIVIADGTTNTFTGSNVYRMLKVQAKKDTVTVIDGTDVNQQKKRWKMDGAFYSFVSMAISGGEKGDGVLNITSTTYEGFGTEMHLAISGGVVNVTSPDDGINVNEDYVSVFTLNGGTLTITSTGADGIDSNGYIILNDGKLTINVPRSTGPEGALDSIYEDGSGIYNGLQDGNYTVNETGGSGDMPPDGGQGPGGGTPPHNN